ncbi:MAG: hypothetical protein KME64_16080 [Scytonematopsis contorta HA4267-MV1]|nr:hypothetical protein [Scytonematopsis contorta HA4267-MV1]
MPKVKMSFFLISVLISLWLYLLAWLLRGILVGGIQLLEIIGTIGNYWNYWNYWELLELLGIIGIIGNYLNYWNHWELLGIIGRAGMPTPQDKREQSCKVL